MESHLPGLSSLIQVMNAASLRHRVIAQNVANVNTPGYKRLEVTFGGELSRAFGGSAATPRVTTADDDSPERVDGNNVDIDKEMNALTKNALLYQAATQIIASRVGSQRSAITGR